MDFQVVQFLLFLIAIFIILNTQDFAAAETYNLKNETDRLALLNVKLQISDDPSGVLKSWNNSHHHCYWEGVTCNVRRQRVTNLTLGGHNLLGLISAHIGNLSFLKSINLGENRFYGEIPQEIGRLFRLRNLNLSSNSLSGGIPVNLSQCSKLRYVRIFNNKLVGKIPPELSSLKKLVHLDFFQNNLMNEIPSSLGNLSSLKVLDLSYNNLERNLPNEIGSLKNLLVLSLGKNQFSGVIPLSVYNISTLSVVSLTENLFEGELPSDKGFKMPNLQYFYIGLNQFQGKIPVSIVNSTNLKDFDLSGNKLQGHVPMNLGNLLSLRILNLGKNLLGGSTTNTNGDLDFITSLTNCSDLQELTLSYNNFGGILPQSIGNLSLQIQEIGLSLNNISGNIPISLTRLVNLYSLSMYNNFFTGTIPKDFYKLEHLQVLYLDTNMLNGVVPSTLCNITSLYELFLNINNLEGTLPSCFSEIQSLKTFIIHGNKLSGIVPPAFFGKSFSLTELDLSNNLFIGPLPPEVGKLEYIISFDVSYNKFSGQIPATLGDCSNLQLLNMQNNFFTGRIPLKLASLKAIEVLDLSQNKLTGEIPKDLERLQNLNYLNLTYNNLEGEVPRNGVFGNSSQIILDGNFRLCGGIPELRLPSCPIPKKTKKNQKLLVIIISIVSSLFAMILISCMCLYFYRRSRHVKNDSSSMPSVKDNFSRISYHELQRATEGFSQENVVGTGNFGVVYKGQLDQQGGKLVAVKVLDLKKTGVSKSFKAECNALKNIRHRNLVSLLTYCSSMDSRGNDFKALIYDFMENGSLDMWLHPKTLNESRLRNLNVLSRLNIAIDVASALQYLHHHCEFVIVHCDLKPSNILLDNDLTAHVSDFGLAKLLPKTSIASSRNGKSSSIAVKGTIGYVAPEYAMGGEATIQGDVYSYGILLLEMFTGKRPTDEIFINDLTLRNYVKQSSTKEGSAEEILDHFLSSRDEEEDRIEVEPHQHGSTNANFLRGNSYSILEMDCIFSILKVGLKCSEISPNDRMDMNEVTRQLQHIKDVFLRTEKKIEHLTIKQQKHSNL
ncbi:hypothetical protein M9H77_19695 [Catharanthus roseus]|uniref:Uncharacterized protein n=1 Tax=Catharanthus roseus TaxID=4058 RepID=A0ACC0BB16_CATRO|nr:hypothetical protein M9H77_19695 [Catharanthus roseus]